MCRTMRKIENSLKLIQEKFKEYKVTISGAAIVPGAVLEQYEIMNRHYGFHQPALTFGLYHD